MGQIRTISSIWHFILAGECPFSLYNVINSLNTPWTLPFYDNIYVNTRALTRALIGTVQPINGSYPGSYHTVSSFHHKSATRETIISSGT